MGDYWAKAKEYADSCFSGKRWGGNATLILVDAALTSSGLKYFTVVVPRVRKFEEKWPNMDFKKLSKKDPKNPELLSLFNNPRIWMMVIEIAKVLDNYPDSDFSSLKRWAEKADLSSWKQDPVGKVKGVGLSTFQYLRMQAGVDTTMPDRIIRKYVEKELGRKLKNEIELVEECRKLARKMGITQVELCWRIWLAESDKEI